jgi:hypothetical protein
LSTTIDFFANDAESVLNSLECSITSHATSRLTIDEVNSLRKPSDALPGRIAAAVLKHCEEQTITGLAAVRTAMDRFETQPESFENWGIVYSSRYLGRSAFAQSLGKYAVEGPWNVSVQVVPHRSLHSPASMLGLTLGCHAPCVGVGGGLDGESDAWLTALSLLEQHSLHGIWLVFSGWEPEVQIDIEGNWLAETRCTALALALQPASVETTGLRLRVIHDRLAPEKIEIPAKSKAIELFERFMATGMNTESMTAMLGGGLRVVIDRHDQAASAGKLVERWAA